ncbi:MAG: hypothetical protein QMD82_02515 [bacterium]|nr:hypothetical protein [bacterium]
MILRFDFRKKKLSLRPLLITSSLLLILLLLITQKEQVIKFGKSLNIREIFATTKVKRAELRKESDIGVTVKKPQVAEKKLALCGVLQFGDQGYAFLKSSEDEKFILREGEYAGSFKLENVFADSVILVWNNGKREVLHW